MSTRSQRRRNNGGRALNVAGYGYGIWQTLVFGILSLLLLLFGISMVANPSRPEDYQELTATRVKRNEYAYEDPKTQEERILVTDLSDDPETLLVYYDKRSGLVTEFRPQGNAELGWVLIGLAVLFLVGLVIMWTLLRRSQTFRRVYGGVGVLDAVF